MINTNNKSYWCIGYLIPFNIPQLRYAPFETFEEMFNDERLNPQPTIDYVFRVTSDGRFFIKYKIESRDVWKRLEEAIEYNQEVIMKNVIYLK